MTNREKQIMEMEEVIRAENEKMFNFRDGYICTPHDQAKALYKLKYRNIREARKEIAKEVLIDLKKRTKWFFMEMPQFVQDCFWIQFEETCRRFGVRISTKTKCYTEAQIKKPIKKVRPMRQPNLEVKESETGQIFTNFLKALNRAAKKIEEIELQSQEKK